MRFRLVPKSSTLDDLERPKRTLLLSGAEKMRLLEPTAQKWMKIDQYTQQQKCRPMTLVSGNIRRTRGGSSWRGPQFLAIWVVTSSDTSEIRPAILYDDMLPLVGLWLIAKWMTLSRYFTLNSVFALPVLDSEGSTFKHNYVKTNEYRPIVSAAKM